MRIWVPRDDVRRKAEWPNHSIVMLLGLELAAAGIMRKEFSLTTSVVWQKADAACGRKRIKKIALDRLRRIAEICIPNVIFFRRPL
jgi:hypothetical protein